MERAVDYERLDVPTSLNGHTAEFARVTRVFQRDEQSRPVLVQEIIDVMWNVDKSGLVAMIDEEIVRTKAALEQQISVREAQKLALIDDTVKDPDGK